MILKRRRIVADKQLVAAPVGPSVLFLLHGCFSQDDYLKVIIGLLLLILLLLLLLLLLILIECLRP